MYRTLVLTRIFEARVVALHRKGSISIYATSEGEEAIAVGSAFAMEERDWLFRITGVQALCSPGVCR